eukprot:Skav222581  [mRNA]  locus=scaffold1897:151688:155916:- [translate_table: standard]
MNVFMVPLKSSPLDTHTVRTAARAARLLRFEGTDFACFEAHCRGAPVAEPQHGATVIATSRHKQQATANKEIWLWMVGDGYGWLMMVGDGRALLSLQPQLVLHGHSFCGASTVEVPDFEGDILAELGVEDSNYAQTAAEKKLAKRREAETKKKREKRKADRELRKAASRKKAKEEQEELRKLAEASSQHKPQISTSLPLTGQRPAPSHQEGAPDAPGPVPENKATVSTSRKLRSAQRPRPSVQASNMCS